MARDKPIEQDLHSNREGSDIIYGQPVSVRDILVERGKSYGKYSTQVRARGKIMSILNKQHNTCQGGDIPADVSMALNDIVLKLIRVVSDLNHEDNYNDLAGYTELLREMQNEGK